MSIRQEDIPCGFILPTEHIPVMMIIRIMLMIYHAWVVYLHTYLDTYLPAGLFPCLLDLRFTPTCSSSTSYLTCILLNR